VPRDRRASAVTLVLTGILSVQIGAGVATTLFDQVGPGGTVFLRCAFSAVLLVALWRPAWRGHSRIAVRNVAIFGFVLAAMNFSFYEALDRIPLGIAVTLEFVGPLTVAIVRSRRGRDLIWAGLAACGIVLLAPPGGDLDALGVALALLAGAFWGVYIVVTARVGRQFEGGDGLAIAMTIAAVLLIPVGAGQGGGEILELDLLVAALAVAVLSSAIPYSVELEALRRLPEGVFGVMMSLEPAVASVVGAIGLEQALNGREILAIGLVLVASIGALSGAGEPRAAEA
jgi:inner membrane transporter RhtA